MSIAPSVKTTLLCAFPVLLCVVLHGCEGQRGCNRFGSDNYDPDALVDDGSCIETRDKFLGQYSVFSDCSANGYLRTISQTADRFVVELSSVNDSLGPILGTVTLNDMHIGPQSVRNGVTVEGAGTYDPEADELHLSLRIRDSRTGSTVITNCLERCVKN